MKYIQYFILTVAVVVAGIVAAPVVVHAQLGTKSVCTGNSNSPVCAGAADGEAKVGGLIKTIINVLLSLTAIISVIMIIVGGIRYATSNGDANAVVGAKNTIIYAIIGLVVSMFAWAIVNFAVSQL